MEEDSSDGLSELSGKPQTEKRNTVWKNLQNSTNRFLELENFATTKAYIPENLVQISCEWSEEAMQDTWQGTLSFWQGRDLGTQDGEGMQWRWQKGVGIWRDGWFGGDIAVQEVGGF